ncbi:uncharacterized protein PG986_002163 [Apiospora aurea]|uniref:Uncharacterized protein n=1 Tax=Apiospora aurea TaxID=335848 RepID=A0ABR1QYV0_9PEZI
MEEGLPPHQQPPPHQQQQPQQQQQQPQPHNHPPQPMDHHHTLASASWHSLPQQPQPPHAHHPLGAPMFGLDSRRPSLAGVDFVYSGVFNPATAAGASSSSAEVPTTSAGPDIQWDMVLAPEQWEQNQNLLTDMSDLSYPNWAFMGGGSNVYPYMNMGPTGGQ